MIIYLSTEMVSAVLLRCKESMPNLDTYKHIGTQPNATLSAFLTIQISEESYG